MGLGRGLEGSKAAQAIADHLTAGQASAGGGVTTVGADEPPGPTMLVESRPALFLCAVLVEKRRQ